MSKNFELLQLLRPGLAKSALDVTTRGGDPAPRAVIGQLVNDEEHEWSRPLRAIRRHWRWTLSFALGLALCVALVVLLMKPTYAPIARIEVDPPGNELFSLDQGS